MWAVDIQHCYVLYMDYIQSQLYLNLDDYKCCYCCCHCFTDGRVKKHHDDQISVLSECTSMILCQQHALYTIRTYVQLLHCVLACAYELCTNMCVWFYLIILCILYLKNAMLYHILFVP